MLDIFIILLLSYYREFPRGELHKSLNFGKEIRIIKGFTKKGFSYFGGFKCLDCYYFIVCCSLDHVLVIWHVILVIFL